MAVENAKVAVETPRQRGESVGHRFEGILFRSGNPHENGTKVSVENTKVAIESESAGHRFEGIIFKGGSPRENGTKVSVENAKVAVENAKVAVESAATTGRKCRSPIRGNYF